MGGMRPCVECLHFRAMDDARQNIDPRCLRFTDVVWGLPVSCLVARDQKSALVNDLEYAFNCCSGAGFVPLGQPITEVTNA